ncbi:MAG: PAS domain S-box protein [Desulfobulbaceae bacterium]|nr:PAS domain S-box protein [Desulfobulbaceae bacterium]
MSKTLKISNRKLSSLKRNCLFAAIIWTTLIFASSALDITKEKSKNLEIAKNEALTTLNKDLAFRYWSTKHGGVYVPVTPETPVNPYLKHIKERDIFTPSGIKLTLMNPAWILRQVMTDYSKLYAAKGKITSLKVLNPANEPDTWHRKALLQLKKGIKEVSEIVKEDGTSYIKLLRPLQTKKGCLKCHYQQGYKIGDVMGGISISIPMNRYDAMTNKYTLKTLWTNSLFLMVGLFTTLFFYLRGRKLINERLRVNDAIHEKEDFIHLLLNSTAEGIYGLDTNGLCTICNPSCLRLLGYEKNDDLIGKEMHSLIHHTKEDGTKHPAEHCKINKIIKTGKGVHVDNELLWRANGTSFNAEYWSYPIFRNGEVVGAVVTFIDITERINVLKALSSSEKRFRYLTENSTDWIWEFDKNNIFTYASPRVFDILGYTPEEVIGKSAFDIIPPSNREVVAKEFASLKEARLPFASLENVNQHKNGKLVTLESSGVPIIDSKGNFCGYRGIDRDISERKMYESQLRQAHKMEAIGTLSGGIAHDFNNILAAILGYADMAKEATPNNSPAKSDIEQVIKAGNRAKDLIKHILSYSHKGVEKHSPVQIHLLVKETLKLLRASIPTTIEIIQNIDSTCGNIRADATQIHQVLMNLCTNAAQSMDEKGGVLEVSLVSVQLSKDDLVNEPNLKPGPYARITVKDSGPGIEQKNLYRIFDPYFTTKEVGKGSGMGLPVVLGIVKSHDGMITVDSKIGQETTFEVYFPLITDNITKTIEDTAALPMGNEKILVVDDEESIITMNKRMLERLGYQVTGKTSSIEALELFRSQPDTYDLVISDQTMPLLTGEKLAEKLMKIRPDIPIIICTGYSSKIDSEKADFLGIKAFMMKPVDKKLLAITIRKVLDNGFHT